jgi:hypothetical protein
LAAAFLAKSILNLTTTRQPIDRLKADGQLRSLCGWNRIQALPHESKYSRAIAQLAASELPQQLHTAVIADRQGARLERRRHQKLDRMLADLPRACDIGAKKGSQGQEDYWRGYMLHLDVADGQIPIPSLFTSASVHDSQAAIPLMTMTTWRVQYLYELMDLVYDAGQIHEHGRSGRKSAR